MLSYVNVRSETAADISLELEDQLNSGRRSGHREEQAKGTGVTVLC